MAHKFSIIADDNERSQWEDVLISSGRGKLAGPSFTLPPSFHPADARLRDLQAQSPEIVLVGMPGAGGSPDASYGIIAWVRAQMPLAQVMAVGPMQQAPWIVGAMRAGAVEYLDRPLRAAALEDALQRLQAAPSLALAPVSRGKLFAVLGARGGCGSTTVAVNLALALEQLRRKPDKPTLLLDAAPLGHAALHLNLKPQFTLTDLLGHTARLDAALLTSLLVRHESGLELLAGASAPLPRAALESGDHGAWLELLLQTYPIVIADLSARLDKLTEAVIEHADRILFVTQTDMVSLWSAAKVRQHLDPGARLRFEMVLNRFTATPEVDLAGVESITHAPLLWKLPNAHAQVVEAIERGQPAAANAKTDLARSYRDFAALLLGRPLEKRRGWLLFPRLRTVEN
jgi:pilus assembly protein CpaE